MPTTSLGVGTFGDEVADLHRRLTAHGFSLPSSEVDRHFFGPATRAAVTDCQREHGLPATGSLDAETARALDAVVAARVVAVQPRGVVASASPTGEGRILAENLSLPGRVEITSHHLPGETGHPGGSIGSVGEGKGGAGGSAGIAARVSGVIVLEHGLPASKTKLRLYQRAFGGQKTLLREVETDAQGQYAIPYTVNGRANIEVYGVGVDGKEVQLSRTKFGAGAEERIDLIAPSALQPAAVEFARLKAAVAPHTNNQPELLKEAVERGERRDFTYLAGTTGWDAGALALASQAFTGEARTKIPAEGFYALARAGLPTEIRQLAHVPKQTVASALRQAAEAGIIDSGQIEKSVQAFAEFAANYRFSTSIRGALSSPKDFVGKARISDTDRAAFSKVVRDAVSDDLWERAKASGVSEAGIKTLQLQGKLAYLTFNNAELTEYLAGKVTSDLLVLIDLGYYDATRWEASLRELSGANATKLDALVPPTFVGRTVDERIQTYTAELARRVRQIDPHAVTVDRIATNKLQGIAETESVGKFLKNATSAGFRLGKTPLSRFVAESSENVWSGIVPEKRENVLNSVRTLSSLYALSPHDEALSALLLAGFTSSIAIARYDFLDFSTRLKKWLPPGPKAGDQDVSTKIFWKAQQQSATVFNVFDGLKRLNAVAYAPAQMSLN